MSSIQCPSNSSHTYSMPGFMNQNSLCAGKSLSRLNSLWTYKNYSNRACQTTLAASCPQQKSENLTKTGCMVDEQLKDEQQQSMPQLGR